MDHEVTSRPSFALLTVSLDRGEAVRAEAGAMVSHDPGVDIETNATGGFLKSLRRAVGGESFFQNTFTATEGGDVQFAPPLPGDIEHLELRGETVYVQSGSYLAGDANLDVDTDFGGARTFLGGEGLFLLRVAGDGPLFVSSYGAIEAIDLDDRDSFVVDTGHVVAFEETADFTVRRVGGLRSTLTSGEGLVCEFTGSGTVWLQSRSQDAFLSWLIPKLPTRSSSSST
ncbi:TIGR00266 family protein [Halobaculum magnesiiphilum]|uniref:TIGR00266 family protein n=1 Tax=Halobaculum magnesiiphilum TaxID=1017351 RepID=A0A8T8WJC9_9EURY|nr:TIGR00266 family protein [Halobaculum magnesiiphilum]QZP39784.1 TIGR00266 family protein [Halobaculum magnesiiphilum]